MSSDRSFLSRPAGWYEDPVSGDALRWWDGEAWTVHLDRPLEPVALADVDAVGSTLGPRFAARVVDLAFTFPLWVGVVLCVLLRPALGFLVLAGLLLVAGAVREGLELSRTGQTFGRRRLGIRVEAQGGDLLPLPAALVRSLLPVPFVLLVLVPSLAPAALLLALDPLLLLSGCRSRTVRDVVAGSVVRSTPR